MIASAKRRRRRGLGAALVLLLAAGCASPALPEPYAFVAREEGVIRPRILKFAVEGEACFSQNIVTLSLRPPWRVRLADTGRAVTRAIESVPGANVLTNVTVRTRLEQYLLFQRVCAIVIGNAGQLK